MADAMNQPGHPHTARASVAAGHEHIGGEYAIDLGDLVRRATTHARLAHETVWLNRGREGSAIQPRVQIRPLPHPHRGFPAEH
jgi:hypothetical protein